ncbi:MAG: hypothetical protein AB1563_00620 [Bacillota bacterium]
MPRLKNKRQAPLVVPVAGREPLYFAPLATQTVSEKVVQDPLVQSNIKRGNLQVLPEGPVPLEPEAETPRRKKGGSE